MTPRERIAELTAQLREAAKHQDPVALAMVQLLKLSLDEMKDSLVSADGNDMLRKQGAAQQLSRLHQYLTTIPVTFATPGASKA